MLFLKKSMKWILIEINNFINYKYYIKKYVRDFKGG
jgi:hypothetical protein